MTFIIETEDIMVKWYTNWRKKMFCCDEIEDEVHFLVDRHFYGNVWGEKNEKYSTACF